MKSWNFLVLLHSTTLDDAYSWQHCVSAVWFQWWLAANWRLHAGRHSTNYHNVLIPPPHISVLADIGIRYQELYNFRKSVKEKSILDINNSSMHHSNWYYEYSAFSIKILHFLTETIYLPLAVWHRYRLISAVDIRSWTIFGFWISVKKSMWDTNMWLIGASLISSLHCYFSSHFDFVIVLFSCLVFLPSKLSSAVFRLSVKSIHSRRGSFFSREGFKFFIYYC